MDCADPFESKHSITEKLTDTGCRSIKTSAIMFIQPAMPNPDSRVASAVA